MSLGGNRYSLKNDSRRKDLNLHTELAFLILTFKEQIILRLDCLSLVMPLNHTRCAFSHPPSTKKEQRYTVQVTSTKNKYEILNDNVTICLYYRCKYLSPVSLLLTTYSRRNFIILALILIFFTLHKEIKILKEEHQYFMDSFQSIRNPITLVHTPLRAACDDSCPEDIKKMLSLVIRNIDCLDEHLTKLMNLRHLLIYSKQMDIAEYELGNFINNRVHSLKNFATDKRIKLEIKTEFNYASVWFDQSKISPIIDKFIKNAIEHSKPEDKRIIFSISSNSEHWELKTFDANKGKLLTCYRRQKYHLIKPKHKSEFKYAFAKSVLCKKLMKLCDGNILINHSTHTVSLRFPTTNSERKVSGYNIIHSAKKSEERKTDTSLGKIAHKKSSIKPTVVLADSNEEFKSYLEECLSKDFDVKSFGNGSEALECIKEKYPDLVICDLMLHGMYGYELSSRLKTSGETSVIPIILYGSRIDIGQRNKRESSLADIFLYVPFHIEDLKIEMNVLIKNNRSLRRSFLQTVFGKQFLEKEEEKVLDDSNYTFINQVKEFILKNIDKENLTIDEIASELYMSRTAFFNKWKALTGEAPKYFIYRIRMEKARELLESGKYSVQVIPEMIGLKNLKNFRHKYKEYFGITPSKSITKKL